MSFNHPEIMHPLKSLIGSGTRLWLDSIDPDLVRTFADLGATGATSNPVIVSDLISTGRFDDLLSGFAAQGLNASEIAWALTDQLVGDAQKVFRDVFESSVGNDGYVSFELDPLLEDETNGMSLDERVESYVELGRKWSLDQPNRMIKVPATPAGLAALGPLTELGIPLNVTLVFSMRQYNVARDAIWNAAVRTGRQKSLKSVYSIFVSRIDVYTGKHVSSLSPAAQGQVGILNAKQIWRANHEFWKPLDLPLDQHIVFASTGTKKPEDAPWKYVAAFAGSDIQTNPPETNEAIANSGVAFEAMVNRPLDQAVTDEILGNIDFERMESVLMEEGIEKFCSPQKKLLALITNRQEQLAGSNR